MSPRSILITGGAGYIGSHTALQLAENGEHVVILDNLVTGFRESVRNGELIVGNAGDEELVSRLLKVHDIDTVMHFAAHTVVPESVSNPLKYYENNTCATRRLLSCCRTGGVKHFVFSSTAAVYGAPVASVCNEDTPTAPINPYGSSKLMSEWMLRDLANATDMKYIILRYFNVAGSSLQGMIGQATKNATLLTKVACEAAVGKRDTIAIFGTDYPTPDGTGIRDYIHVDDLARAHIMALGYLRDGGYSQILNCGYGRGYSVREVLKAIEDANGSPLPIVLGDRRPGDPPSLIAGANKIRRVLGWAPEFDDLQIIARSSLDWERKLLVSPWGSDRESTGDSRRQL